ncbi:1-acyl-sn-glycerol-3-phosphate acyltransferase [Tamaricihabitans halophyticus]|uniref:1-acyl-sn-glycerol-3-phosphate acyltransferase n=1 Tax=Tamaricihabitans halophyticus TaxID=1262583 RepID=A0A4R2PY67_9PSEU|nr:lysophospholipid acyltransferase family protein [Tamaricihabitans halophyticus]TCP39205.1 1-acyl-sn-glycerol-3-phosphate acyltransferase [Tamaricihabitans halophyticus]
MTELPEGAWPRFHDFCRKVADWLYRPTYRLRVTGLSNVPAAGPVVLVANHSSLVEPQMIFGALPRRAVFLVKRELFRGVVGWLLHRMGQISVRRNEPDRAALSTAVRVLRAGGLVAVFPEGSRGRGDMATAHGGAAWLVRASGARVLPVACRGTLRPPGVRRRFRPVVDLAIGKPLDLDVARGRAGLDEATERLRKTLAELVRELDERRAESGIEK